MLKIEELMQLQDKVAIITGGSKGIGEGIVRKFAAEGAKVVIADIDTESAQALAEELKADGVEALAVATDVSDRSAVEKLFADTIAAYGGVDVVVNNAGIYPSVSTEEMSEEDWDKVIYVNLKGVFLMSQEAAKVLPEGGRIINISSIASIIGFAGMTHYCASKAGINGYTRSLALELAPRKITVNAIAPGAIDTPGTKSDESDESARQQTAAGVPLGRWGSPAEIAHAATYLAAPDASYVTGQVLVVDGGWTIR